MPPSRFPGTGSDGRKSGVPGSGAVAGMSIKQPGSNLCGRSLPGSERNDLIEYLVKELLHPGGVGDPVLGKGVLGSLVGLPVEERVAGAVHDV